LGSIPIARSILRPTQTTSDNSSKPNSMVVGKVLGFGVDFEPVSQVMSRAVLHLCLGNEAVPIEPPF
jgi:hypothetical protein